MEKRYDTPTIYSEASSPKIYVRLAELTENLEKIPTPVTLSRLHRYDTLPVAQCIVAA